MVVHKFEFYQKKNNMEQVISIEVDEFAFLAWALRSNHCTVEINAVPLDVIS